MDFDSVAGASATSVSTKRFNCVTRHGARQLGTGALNHPGKGSGAGTRPWTPGAVTRGNGGLCVAGHPAPVAQTPIPGCGVNRPRAGWAGAGAPG